MLKAVILIGGPLKGTRFRPLSLDIPKPLFPVAGLPMIQHHIEACVNVPNLKEILILGYYPASELSQFVEEMIEEYKVNIRYLQEFTALGTAGGIYHFRDQIRCGNTEAFFVLNGDVCADFPLVEMLHFHQEKGERSLITMMTTEATRQQSVHYGCIVLDKETCEVNHYVEKPSTFVSTLINCGVYLCSVEIFQTIAAVFNTRQQEYYSEDNGGGNGRSGELAVIQLERDILMAQAGGGRLFALQTSRWWSQLKTAGSAIYANRHYLELYRTRRRDRLAGPGRCTILGDVHIHPSATVHPTAVLGPNVSIGSGAVVGPGVRVRESIVLSGAHIADHSLVLHSIIGRGSRVGKWTRVEGTPCDPNPNKPFAKMDNPPLFNSDGRLNPSITILGCSVTVPSEVILLNSIVLPYKELTRSFKNEIIL
ncbi:mannose-1-phosphate guanyltransferase alpha-A isoform X2 [Schistocerca americana]|uniref:mannose-1-phosphate guanyltransferase alpha-A isoform X2 n=1 Tax=Schistocerca americana TaxID=7009 RepID=UPI001F4F5717|nr:mannose-1-phosphate guanyltransferase alpha-A isoform X2 [Schistocerca americana]XP_047119331.1 mannose-1-phosphate guanyltransferase alpha-A isoform X2 [Schistocerca piceifrons]XP_049763275.1 mannose-1-phosphate guanyltransferase alpha-A isoform X2 [Schistocerca cancellata]XP_049789000.1 mannose-1-phosphate guanyltransferase alpha-A isoform X2 [Schistocerca nitens]XP_049833638.1 mannose-1-phosphate guanyltransferase alpha-A isoform X2 [Schistocerca gregaria]XP_049939533.1 mannose-1-phospha